MARKHYTDDQVAHALAILNSNGGNLLRASKQTGVQRATLRAWQAGDLKHHNPQQVEKAQTGIEATIVERLDGFVLKATERANTAEYVSELKGRDLLIAAGIAIDKAQLLKGGPTKRVDTQIRVSLTGGLGLRELSAKVIDGDFKALPDTIPQRQD